MTPHDAGLPDPGSQFPPPSRDPVPIAGRIDRPTVPPPGRHSLMPQTPPGLSAPPDFWSLLDALRRRWAAAVLIGGPLALLVAAGVYYLLIPRSVAVAKIRVGFSELPVLGAGQFVNSGDFKTQIQ